SDVVLNDHRPLGWDRVEGSQAWVDLLREGVRAAPDAQLRVTEWLSLTKDAAFFNLRMSGTVADGGAFELDRIGVARIKDGLWAYSEAFDADQLDEARRAMARRVRDASRPG